jgi:hypothetical protein
MYNVYLHIPDRDGLELSVFNTNLVKTLEDGFQAIRDLPWLFHKKNPEIVVTITQY